MKTQKFLLAVFWCIFQACGVENGAKQAKPSPLCRVLLPPASEQNTLRGLNPHLFFEHSPLQSDTYGSKYHLFWEKDHSLYHATRTLSGASSDASWKAVQDIGSWDLGRYNGQFVLAYRNDTPNKPIHLITGIQSPTETNKQITLPHTENAESITLSIQGQTAAVVFSQRAKEEPTVQEIYIQLVPLCALSKQQIFRNCHEDLISYCTYKTFEATGKENNHPPDLVSLNMPAVPASTLDAPIFETGEQTTHTRCPEVDGKKAEKHTNWFLAKEKYPVFLGKGSSPSLVGFEANAFLIAFQPPEGGWKLVRVPLDLSSQNDAFVETTFDNSILASPFLVTVLSKVFAFLPVASSDVLEFSQIILDSSQQPAKLDLTPSKRISLRKSSFSRYLSILEYQGSPQKRSSDGFAALWSGKGFPSSEGEEMYFALFSQEGVLKEEPLWVLPTEKIQSATMVGSDLEDRSLRFGIFYEQKRKDLGLGFIQIACEDVP